MNWFKRLFSQPSPTQADEFSSDDYSNLALKEIFSLGLRASPSWIGGRADTCEGVLTRIQQLRKEYASREPPKLRRAYLYWLDYYEGEARSNLEDIKSQSSRRSLDEHKEKRRNEEDRVRRLREALGTSHQA